MSKNDGLDAQSRSPTAARPSMAHSSPWDELPAPRAYPRAHVAPKSPGTPEQPESPEKPEGPKYPGCPGSPVPPVSVGHQAEKALKMLAGRNACQARKTARKRLWQLARDLSALEKKVNRELEIAEIIVVCSEWYRLSQPFLEPAKTYDTYLAALVAALRKVRVPTGEDETVEKALGAVSKLSSSQLPVIGACPTRLRVGAE